MLRSLLAAVVACLALSTPAAAQENPWLAQRVMNFAHQGGEDELPSNTLYAFTQSLNRGADWLEIDVNLTKDDQLAVMHDTTLDRTTNGTGPVVERTLAEIQQLDAAYWHVADAGARRVAERRATDTYPFRGMRTGTKPPPRRFAANDFRVPSLLEVFDLFRGVINIEIKGETEEIQMRTAEVLARQIAAAGRGDNVIVVSFNQNVVDRFHQLAPDVPLAPGVGGGARFLLQNESPGEGVVAFQIPITFDLGGQKLVVATPENVKRAHEAGYAVHVWLSNDTEDVPTYRRLLNMCVDAIMAAKPSLLARELRRYRGEDPCGTRVANGRPTARGGRVKLDLRRRGQSKERRTGTVALHGLDRRGRLQVVLGRARWTLGSDRSRTTASVRLNRVGRAAVAERRRLVARAIVSERGRSVSVRDVRLG
ncbi:MAG TPA: glycerophosphodiester phosphodiesterase family protein [Solirubrobacteraceae bacterium]|nr:glycerophosphodiester phosphodiesterase family protein [Solirubrobacteraceae bacterium]